MRGRFSILTVVAVCFLLGLQAAAMAEEALPEKVEMYYFYDNLCGSCNATEAFDAAAEAAMSGGEIEYPYVIYRHNVYGSAGKQAYRALCEDMGLDPDALSLPVFIAGGRVFQGEETIASNLREAYLVAGEDLFVNRQVYTPAQKKTGEALFDEYEAAPEAITVVYFYRIVCEECVQTAPVIDSLPKEITVHGRTVTVDVIRINTRSGNNGDRIGAFFSQYSVPDEDRMVPIVFTAERYFAGYEAIASELEAALAATPAGFVFPSGEDVP